MQKESKVLYKRGGKQTDTEGEKETEEMRGENRQVKRKKGTEGWREQGDTAQPTGGVFDGA